MLSVSIASYFLHSNIELQGYGQPYKSWKFKIHCLDRSFILKINPYAQEDVIGDYNKQNLNFPHPE